MVAGGTSNGNRGRGTTRKLLSNRTLPKDSASAPYKIGKNPVGRPRSKSRTKSRDSQGVDMELEQEEKIQENMVTEETQQTLGKTQRKEQDLENMTARQEDREVESEPTRDEDLGEEEMTISEKDARKKEKGKEKENNEETYLGWSTAHSLKPSVNNREILKKMRYRSEINTQMEQEEAKNFLELIKESFYSFPSFLGAHITRKSKEGMTITAEFGEEEQMQESLQIRFDNEKQNQFQQVMTNNRGRQDQRGVIIRDIPLNTQISTIKGILSRYGVVEDLKIKLVGMWQTATATFQEEEDAQHLSVRWAIPFEKEYVRILPLSDHWLHNQERSRYILKLAGIPRGTTAFDIEQIKEETNAKTIYIPRREWDYDRERYAYMSFESNEDFKKALDKTFTIGRQTAKLVTEHTPICFRCGETDHLSYECRESKVARVKQRAIQRFTAVQEKFSNRHGEASSYAEALKRNRDQSKTRLPPRTDNEPQKENNRRMEDRVLNLEIKMTEMHNLLMKIANKIQYWEDMEEEELRPEGEYMDMETQETPETAPIPKGTLRQLENQPNHPRPEGTQAYSNGNISDRQAKLEASMSEMAKILVGIAQKMDNQRTSTDSTRRSKEHNEERNNKHIQETPRETPTNPQ